MVMIGRRRIFAACAANLFQFIGGQHAQGIGHGFRCHCTLPIGRSRFQSKSNSVAAPNAVELNVHKNEMESENLKSSERVSPRIEVVVYSELSH